MVEANNRGVMMPDDDARPAERTRRRREERKLNAAIITEFAKLAMNNAARRKQTPTR